MDILAVIIVTFEAIALALAGAGYVVYALVGDPVNRGAMAVLGALALLMAAGIGAAARGWWQSQRWARSVALTWQILQAAVGLYYLLEYPGGGARALGTVLIVASAVVTVAVVRATGREVSLPPDGEQRA